MEVRRPCTEELLGGVGAKEAEDFDFLWSPQADEYRYLYQPDITGFVDSDGKRISLYDVVRMRGVIMREDYKLVKENQRLAALGLERRRKYMQEWDDFWLLESELILPFMLRLEAE